MLALKDKSRRVINNYFTRTYPTQYWVLLVHAIIWIGLLTIGIHAMLEDAWTTKEWILFAAVLVFLSLVYVFLSCDCNITIIFATIALLLAIVASTWLFI